VLDIGYLIGIAGAAKRYVFCILISLKYNYQINLTPIGYAIIGVPDSYMVVFR
jgi:hypothetical protein